MNFLSLLIISLWCRKFSEEMFICFAISFILLQADPITLKRLSIVKTGSFLFAFEIVYSFVISSHLGHRAKPIYCESEASNWKQTWAGGKKSLFKSILKCERGTFFFHLSDNQKKTSLYTFSRHRSLSVSSFFLPSTNSQKSFDSVTDL